MYRIRTQIDPEDRSILIFRPHQQPELLRNDQQLQVLEGINLQLTVDQIFAWLKMNH
jgi:Uma2 family endonuclease